MLLFNSNYFLNITPPPSPLLQSSKTYFWLMREALIMQGPFLTEYYPPNLNNMSKNFFFLNNFICDYFSVTKAVLYFFIKFFYKVYKGKMLTMLKIFFLKNESCCSNVDQSKKFSFNIPVEEGVVGLLNIKVMVGI